MADSPDRLEVFQSALDGEEDPFLTALEAEARGSGVPVIRRPARRILRVLLAAAAPERILEVGAAVGYSAIFMAKETQARVTTLEIDAQRAAEARANAEKAGLSGRIEVLCGDAAEILPTLEGSYGFIFMDAAKGQYVHFLPEVLRLLAPGGMLVSDNVLQGGTVLDSRFLVERRERTIHSRLRAYLYELTHRPELSTVLLREGDGLAVTVKRR